MTSTVVNQIEPTRIERRGYDGHVALLTNYIPPYALPVYLALAHRVGKLTLLLSTPMEPNRNWDAEWGSLNVKLQRTISLQRPWKHPVGFRESMSVHLPLDTLGQLRSLRPDVVVSAQLGVRSLLAALYAGWTRTPLALFVNLSEHQERNHGRLRNGLRRWLIRRATAIAVNGTSGARYLRRLGAEPGRLFHVPYAALPGFDNIPLERTAPGAHTLLYAGQLIERKGLLPFVEALARWARRHDDEQVQLDVAGSGPLEGALRAMVLPANFRLQLLGERSYAELRRCYAQASVLAFPTLSDEWGLVVNEAMAAGMPVLGSVYSQAVEDLCVEGRTGWRFRPDVPGEMDAAIDRALATPPEQLEAMRAWSRKPSST